MHNEMPSEAQRLAVASFRKFLDSEVVPVAREFRDRSLPKGRMRELAQGIAEFGLPGASIAEEQGGLGLARLTEAMLFEELGTLSADVALCVKTNKAVAAFLAGLPAQRVAIRERYLPDLLGGRSFGAFCLDTGATADTPRVTARREGEDFILDGEQTWVANGHYADFVIVAARSDADQWVHLLVDRRAHGFVTRNAECIALHSQSTAQVFFSQTRVPGCQLLGEDGVDLQESLRALDVARIDTGLLCVGLMRAALEASLEPARQRLAGGPDTLLAAQLAEMATLADAARLLCRRAYGLIDAGLPCDPQVSMAKWYASEMAVQVCRNAVQLQGADGLARAGEVERLVREALSLPLSDGVTDTHKMLIARTLLGISTPI
ncbi:acyl-CoA dehydrogenase family protein [Pseudomonas sp. QE6]|uniref:acyl-CoA dehydrogenase family protein n=1 Tax=Pseudomonas sp. QE6 TaxID=3242491 RepID=UPI003528D5BC